MSASGPSGPLVLYSGDYSPMMGYSIITWAMPIF